MSKRIPKNKKIAIYGGSFNPIHLGHLLTAYTVLENLNYDYIFFIPDNIPVHKELADNTSAYDRLKMIKLSVSNIPQFIACDIEIKRGGKSYTIDTINHIEFHYSPCEKIGIIIGDDWIDSLHSWKDIDILNEKCQFICLLRRFSQPVSSPYNIKWVKNRIIEISSTEIRERRKKNLPIDYFVDNRVKKYILNKKLYI